MYLLRSKIRPILLVNNEINLENQNLIGNTLVRQQLEQQQYSEFAVRAIENPWTIKLNIAKSSLNGIN